MYVCMCENIICIYIYIIFCERKEEIYIYVCNLCISIFVFYITYFNMLETLLCLLEVFGMWNLKGKMGCWMPKTSNIQAHS